MGPPACLYLCSSLAGALLLFPWKPFHQIPPHNRRGERDISKGCQTLLHEVSQLWWVHPHQSVTLASCRLSSQVSVHVAGHGAGYQPPKCNNVKMSMLDAITRTDKGKIYAFAGNGLLMCIKRQSFLHHIQAFHSWLHHWPCQDPSTCACPLSAMVSIPSPSLICGRRWLEEWMLYFPTVTKCT